MAQALASVVEQSIKPAQIIIINDASETSHDIDYQQLINSVSHNNIHYKKLEHKMGANFARNYAVNIADSELVAFLDDDDAWHKDYLLSHQRYHQDIHTAAVLSGFNIMGEDTQHINTLKIVDEAALKQGNQFCGMSGISAKRDILIRTPFDETLSNGQDWDLLVRLVQSKQTVLNISKAIFDYRKNADKSISVALKNMQIDQSDTRLASAYKHREWLGEAHFKYRVADQLLAFIQHKPDKIKWLRKSIRLAGFRLTFLILFSKVFRR